MSLTPRALSSLTTLSQNLAVKVRLALGNQLRLECAATVARDCNLNLAVLGQPALVKAPQFNRL
jgi:hypothetical protein